MHPMVLESLTQQRLQDLRSGVSPRPRSHETGCAGSEGRDVATGPSGPARVGPVSRTQAKMGLWMVETGSRLVRNGGGDSLAESALSGRASDKGRASGVAGDNGSSTADKAA